WCEGHGLTALPASPAAVATFLSSRADAGAAVSTLGKELSAIAAVHRDADHDGIRKTREVRAVLAGLRRSNARPPRRVAALTLAEVRAVSKALPGTLIGKRDRALILLGLAGAFRRSELVALQVADLDWRPEGLVVHVGRSKSDQEGHGADVGIP